MKRFSEDWGALIREQLSSGLSQVEFCRQRGVSVASFQYHKGKKAHLEESSGFVPIVAGEDPKQIELRVGDKAQLFFPVDTPAEYLSEVVRCLSLR